MTNEFTRFSQVLPQQTSGVNEVIRLAALRPSFGRTDSTDYEATA